MITLGVIFKASEMMKEERKRVAIIGSGIAGLASCHILGEKYDVTIFEREATVRT